MIVLGGMNPIALPATSSALDARYQAEARALLEKLPR